MTEVVLIVDDSLTVRMDLAEAFEAAGFRAVVCTCVSEARDALARERIALAVLDVLLPDGDGIELLAEIRAMPSRCAIPILVLSSEAEVRERLRDLERGADDFVGKPYDRDALVERARALLPRAAEPGSESCADLSTILVIDDSPTFRAELRHALEGAGYSVLTAVSGQEGLSLAALHRPSAAVVDGVMPGIDGGTVIRRMRLDAALRGTPCLLLTGSEDRGAELRALDAGADAFVRKEEPLEVVLARLAAVLRTARTNRSRTASLLGPKRILAVDDSMTYLQELAATLRVEGYDVILAASGEAALEELAQHPVDCILLDLVMPGLGGKETCRRIKDSPGLREIPLIMITALEDRAAMIDGLTAGADDYLPKSSDFEVLNARVRAQIRRKQFEDEHRKIQEELRRSEFEAAEARASHKLAEAKAALADELEQKNRELEDLAQELERKNKELEAFSYSASHDLRGPLRSISGFSHLLLEHHAASLNEEGRNYLSRVCASARRMGEIIEDLLELSRVSLADLERSPIQMSDMARSVADELRSREPERQVEFAIAPGLVADGDARLVRVLLENVLGNAWKFTARASGARIEFGAEPRGGETVYCIRDNGAGFDMAFAEELFRPFKRLHTEADFPGTGIGLATVQRIVDRHGGRIWAHAAVGEGAAFFFTLPPRSPRRKI